LRALFQSQIFRKDRELGLFAYSLSQAGREYYKRVLGLQPAAENPEPTPGLVEPHYENVQDNAIIAWIPGLASMEAHAEEEEMPEEDSLDEDK
jgi:hypothetical protein